MQLLCLDDESIGSWFLNNKPVSQKTLETFRSIVMPKDLLHIRVFVSRMKGSKRQIINSQIFEKAANLWTYLLTIKALPQLAKGPDFRSLYPFLEFSSLEND